MGYPIEQDIFDLFSKLAQFPEGHQAFFAAAREDSTWHLTGQHRFSGKWQSKDAFLREVWSSNTNLIQPPGPCIILPRGHESIIYGQNGRVAVELLSVNMVTKQTKRAYKQHYSWHCQFNDMGQLVSTMIFLDSDHAMDVLVGEKKFAEEQAKGAEDKGDE